MGHKRLNKETKDSTKRQKSQQRDKRLNKGQMTQQRAQKTQQRDTKDSTKRQFCKSVGRTQIHVKIIKLNFVSYI